MYSKFFFILQEVIETYKVVKVTRSSLSFNSGSMTDSLSDFSECEVNTSDSSNANKINVGLIDDQMVSWNVISVLINESQTEKSAGLKELKPGSINSSKIMLLVLQLSEMGIGVEIEYSGQNY